MKFGAEENEERGEASRKEREDWRVAEMGGGSWRRRRGDLRVKKKGLRR